MVYEMLKCWGSNLVKSEVQRLLDNEVRFEGVLVRVCK